MKIYLYAALGVAALAALAWFVHEQREIGSATERARQEKENTNAVENAEDFAATLRDCRSRGGVYNFETGKCSVSGSGDGWFSSWLPR